MEDVRVLLLRLRDEGASAKYYIALKLLFHKSADVGVITDPPVTISNGEVLVLSPAHSIEAQLEAAIFNIMTRIDNYEEVYMCGYLYNYDVACIQM